jgi:hypothetical protein
MKSARSVSSDGDAYSDTSDSQSNRSDNQSSRRDSPRKQKNNTNPLALVAQHPNLVRKMRLGTAGTVGGGVVINMDQVRSFCWTEIKLLISSLLIILNRTYYAFRSSLGTGL